MDAGESMTVAFTYTLDDFVAAQRLHALPSQRDGVMLGLVMLIFVSFMAWLNDAVISTVAVLVVALAASLVMWWFLIVPWTARRNFVRVPNAELSFRFTLLPNGLRQRSARGQSVLLWREFTRWRMNRETILLYTSPRHFLLVPARLATLGFPLSELQATLVRELGAAQT